MKEPVEARFIAPKGSGGTLSDRMAQHKPLPFPTVVDYLEQLSKIIDSAHERGRIYRNIQPSTILLTFEGRLVLTKVEWASARTEQAHEQGDPHHRRPAGSQVEALTYLAPEQILERNVLSLEARNLSGIAGMNRAIDGRADLYSLGVVLYEMVTGVVPFSAETTEQLALKHLRMPPPSPRQLRPDLPAAAEQAILRALAKRPADRYVRAQDLAIAFRVALMAAEIQLDNRQNGVQSFTHRGLFDPVWQTGMVPIINNGIDQSEPMGAIPVGDADLSSSMDDARAPLSPAVSELLPLTPAHPEIFPTASASPEFVSTTTGAQPTLMPPEYNPVSPLPDTHTTGMLPVQNADLGNTGKLKLTGPAKIVQVPVAGQPGLYVTGLLPVFPAVSPPSRTGEQTVMTKGGRYKRISILTLAVAVMFVVVGSGIFWLVHTHSGQIPRQSMTTNALNLNATATAQAVATANANVILVDPLSQNIHNWPIATTGSMLYIFKDGAYHITDNNDRQGAPAILPDETLQGSFAYTLTMEEIKGDDTSINNEFGMIIRASSQNKNGKLITTFYSFEVLNTRGGEYQFWKYDNSRGPNVTPWTKLWHHPFGKEFHQGHGTGSVNTFKIFVNGKNFTLIVNGKQITTVQDSACNGCPCTCSGGVGMLVNLKGTEVAFSNLQLTYK